MMARRRGRGHASASARYAEEAAREFAHHDTERRFMAMLASFIKRPPTATITGRRRR